MSRWLAIDGRFPLVKNEHMSNWLGVEYWPVQNQQLENNNPQQVTDEWISYRVLKGPGLSKGSG